MKGRVWGCGDVVTEDETSETGKLVRMGGRVGLRCGGGGGVVEPPTVRSTVDEGLKGLGFVNRLPRVDAYGFPMLDLYRFAAGASALEYSDEGGRGWWTDAGG